jgi:hypothetical protein
MGKARPVREDAPRAALGEAVGVFVDEHRDSRGMLRLWRQDTLPLYCARVVGHLSIGLAREIIAYAEPMFGSGRVLAFHDWFAITGYDSASRNELTAWSRRHAAHVQLNIGVRSTLVNLGVTVAALALGEHVLRRFHDEQQLEDAYQGALLTLSAERSPWGLPYGVPKVGAIESKPR